MAKTKLSRLVCLGGLVFAVQGSSASSRADGIADACNADSERAQRQRQAGKLVAARDQFRRCARQECPRPIASFCLERLAETEAALPTVVVRARNADGTEIPNLEVSINGAIVGMSDGRAIAVDPGPNSIRVTRGSASFATSVVVAEGEKLRAVMLTIGAPDASPKPEPRTSPPALAWVLGAVGLASASAGVILWSTGLSDRSSELEPGGCAPRCTDERRDAIHTRLLIGDGLLVLGVVSLGVATYLFLKPPRSDRVASH